MSDHHEPAEKAQGTPGIDPVPQGPVEPVLEHSEFAPAPAAVEEFPPKDPSPAEPESLPPGEAKPERLMVRRGGTPLPVTLLFCAALGGGIFYTWSHPQPGASQGSIDVVRADLGAQIQALSDRVDKLEKLPPPAAPTTPAGAASPDGVADLAKHVDDVSGHLDALSARQDQLAAAIQKTQDLLSQKPAESSAPPAGHAADTAAAAQAQQQLADLGGKMDQALSQEKASLDALEQRLRKLEQAPPQSDTSAITVLQSRVQKLEQGEGQIAGAKQDATLAVKLEAAQVALAAGTPLGEVPGAPPALARFAIKAPPTEAALRASFPATADAILAASRPEEIQKSFFARTFARLEQSVTVRQGDRVLVGDPAAGVVERAHQALNNGDLKGAVAALSRLSGKAAEAASAWVAQAQSLVDARAALATLAAHG